MNLGTFCPLEKHQQILTPIDTGSLVFIVFGILQRLLVAYRSHSDYRTVSPYWVLPVYVELIRAVWADDADRPLLF
jgi:hypothetical protein